MAQCMIFEEDEVCFENEKGLKYGLVLESSEYVSSDEEEEDDSYWDRVKRGSLRVAWHPDGKEEVIAEKSVKLVDRSLMPGDVVRRLIEGQDSQRGYVTNTKVLCHLQILGKSKVICEVNSCDLQFLEYWDTEPGNVYLDSWVGKIDKVTLSITFKFFDGARFVVDEDEFYDLCTFEDLHEKRDRDSEFATQCFYPGQRWKGELGELEGVKWLNSTRHHSPEAVRKCTNKEVIATVEKVVAEEMEVHWLCQGYCKVDDPDAKMGPPARILKKEDITRIKKIDVFEPCSVQIGDKAFYTLKNADTVHNFPQKGSKSLMHYIIRNKVQGHSKVSGNVRLTNVKNETSKNLSSDTSKTDTETRQTFEEASSATYETTRAEGRTESNDIAGVGSFQKDDEDADDNESDDGSSCSEASNQSTSSNTVGKKKKSVHKRGGAIPTRILKKKKLKKSKKREEIAMWEFKPGDKIPCEVISTMSFVEVMWQDRTIETDIPSTELHPIHHLDDLEFFPGDFVVPANVEGERDTQYGVVCSVDHAGRTCQVQWIKPNQCGTSTSPVEMIEFEEVSVYDIQDHLDYKFRPGHLVVRVGGYKEVEGASAGQVFKLGTDGKLNIHWADGSKSSCYPQELYLIQDDTDGEKSSSWFNSVLSELSELNSEADSDASDSDSSGHSSEGSWETESETDVASDEGERPPSVVPLGESAKKLFDVVITSLQYLEEFFSLPMIEFCQNECFKEVLKVYKTCKEVDKKLRSAYFDDPKLKKVISAIKSEMKRERQAHFASKVKELIDKNQPQQTDNQSKDADEKPEDSAAGECGSDTSIAKPEADASEQGEPKQSPSPKGEEELDVKCEEDKSSSEQKNMECEGTDPSQTQKKDDVTDVAIIKPEEGACAINVLENSSGKSVFTDLYKESLEKLKKLMPESMNDKNKQGFCVIFRNQVLDLCKGLSSEIVNLSKAVVDQVDQATQTASQTSACGKCGTNARDLCQTACHLLRETVIRIRETYAGTEVGDAENGDASPDALMPNNESEQTSEKEAMDTELEKETDLKLELPLTGTMSESEVDDLLKSPGTPAEVREKIQFNADGFTMLESAPNSHKFTGTTHEPVDTKLFLSSYRRELKLLRTSLPYGIYVKGFEDRMDLFSVMIHGPKKTPYEDGLFFFDIKLPNDFPMSPPMVHYIAFCSDRLNPNLYEDGKVCVSLLGTWQGRGTEVWTKDSNFLQVLISIQGLILVSEPYYNEAGFEKQKGSQQGHENSRMYNEMALLKLIQSMSRIVTSPPEVFEKEVLEYLRKHAFRMIARLEFWLSTTKQAVGVSLPITMPPKSPNLTVPTDNSRGQSPAGNNPELENELTPEIISDTEKQKLPTTDNTYVENSHLEKKTSAELFKCDETGQIQDSQSVSSDQEHVVRTVSSGGITSAPEYPLLPVSKGFVLTVKKYLRQYETSLNKAGIAKDVEV